MSTLERIRKRIRSKRGSARYEISPRKSSKHFYLMVYDTQEQCDVGCFSTLNLKGTEVKTYSLLAASKVGEGLAAFCKGRGITAGFYFNKLTYPFHGKVKAAYDAFISNVENVTAIESK